MTRPKVVWQSPESSLLFDTFCLNVRCRMYTCQYVDLNDYIINILVFISRLYANFCAYQCLYTIYPVLHFKGKGQRRCQEGRMLRRMLVKHKDEERRDLVESEDE